MPTSNTTLRYALYFALTYAIIVVIINLVINFLQLDIGNAGNIGALMGAIAFSANKFAMIEKRPVERKENFKISITSLTFAYLISIGLAVIVSVVQDIDLMAIIQHFSPIIMAAALAIISVIYLAVIYFTFGWFVKIMLKNKKS